MMILFLQKENQNISYWALKNPEYLHQRPRHSQKLTLWFGVASSGDSGPYFFETSEGSAVTATPERTRVTLWN